MSFSVLNSGVRNRLKRPKVSGIASETVRNTPRTKSERVRNVCVSERHTFGRFNVSDG
jgi:hypothetical protein